jgi:outer membrane receptor for ferric coprogen and ferric-rhodotorulic acid
MSTKKTGSVSFRLSSAAALVVSPLLIVSPLVIASPLFIGSPLVFAEAPAASELELGTVHVKEAVNQNTEHSGSYTTRQLSIGKTPRSIRETPQSVSVITRQRLDDQNITTIGDAIKYATGVTGRVYIRAPANRAARLISRVNARSKTLKSKARRASARGMRIGSNSTRPAR